MVGVVGGDDVGVQQVRSESEREGVILQKIREAVLLDQMLEVI